MKVFDDSSTAVPPTLLAAARQRRLAHAYLFLGPAESSFAQGAVALAQTLNCSAAPFDQRPCLSCNACRRIALGVHPDLHVVEPEGSTFSTGQVQSLLQDLKLKAMEGPWRVFLLQRANQMTPEAANRLLKMLEEPPDQTVIILASPTGAELLPTIVSRCQILNFPLPSEDEVVNSLSAASDEEQPVSPATALYLTRLAGRYEDEARHLLGVGAAGELRDQVLTIAQHLLTGRPKYALQAAQLLADDGDLVAEKLLILDAVWRDVSLLQTGLSPHQLYHADYSDQLQQLARQWPVTTSAAVGTLEKVLTITGELRRALASHVGRQLACNASCLKIATLLAQAKSIER